VRHDGAGVTVARAAVRLVPALLAARAVVPVAVRAVSLPQLLQRAPVRRDEPTVDVDDAAAVIVAFEAGLRRLPRGTGTCLTRSLWRAIALRRAGVAVDFVLGVRAGATGQPEGHAWLELRGAPFLEARPENLAHFTRAWCERGGADVADPAVDARVVAVDSANGWTP
jgi:hypothetical protein